MKANSNWMDAEVCSYFTLLNVS